MAPSVSTQSLDMIRRLIGFDTTSRNSNLELIHYVQAYLEGHGVASTLVHDETGKKANLYATLGPQDRPGIALSGHTDVVPIDGQEWGTDPWNVIEKDGRLFGRGTCDMKGFVGIALAMVPHFLKRDIKTPIHLVLSHDEEVGCVGVRRLIHMLKDMPIKPCAIIIGEPTNMKVVIAHKGKLSVRCHVRGYEAHSSLAPHAVNAIEYAADVIVFLRKMGERFAAEGPFDKEYDVPHTTAHTGIVQGGTALNIVPKDCSFDFEFRYLPHLDPAALLREVKDYAENDVAPRMRARVADTGFSWEDISSFPGLDMRDDAEIVSLAKTLSGANSTTKVAFGTEAGLFQNAQFPTIVCGPGSIEQAHKPNEFVAMEQLALCEQFMHRLADHVAGSH
ncbi:MAG: acetylornithine deacetylase [Dongiaceae bacterium]